MLGPVELRHQGRELSTGSARERFVLATLLLNAGRTVAAGGLIDELWDEPPASAKAQLHNLISGVRRRLRGAGGDLISTRPLGYRLDLGEHGLDLHEFRRLGALGRRAADAGEHLRATAAFAEALALWRGPALADLPDGLAVTARQALQEEKLAVAEARLDAQLALGRYHEAVREADALVVDHPYRDRLHERRLLALVGAGRRADALAIYQRTHRRYKEDLGVEPGRQLRELALRILHGEGLPARKAPPPIPRQLPPVTATMTGRDTLLDEITTALQAPGTPPVAALVGQGGVGKTTLAVAVADALADRFPRGQLYADLRGSHEQPCDPYVVAGRFLRALGVAGAAVPEDRDERIALYRSQLADSRCLVVLDDAASEEQVRPLLPAGGASAALVTSRRRLAALMGAARWTIPVLAPDEARSLFAAVVGAELEPAAVERILGLCGRLPLAVSIAAARLAVHPRWTVDGLLESLSEEHGRLDELAVGDLDVRATISLSYRALDGEARAVFRRLGMVAAPDWPAWVADTLLDGRRGRVALDALVDVHLVEPLGPDSVGQPRFRMHDLVREYAVERALAEEPAGERAAALSRLCTGWLSLATVADRLVPGGPPDTASDAVPPRGADKLVRTRPLDWFEAERVGLAATVGQACVAGEPVTGGRLALRMSAFLALRAHDDDWVRVLRRVLGHLRGTGEHELLALLLGELYEAYVRTDRITEIGAIAEEELAAANRQDDWRLLVRALTHAGRAARAVGRFARARELLDRAVATGRGHDDAGGLVADALRGLANTHRRAGRPERAIPLLEEADGYAAAHPGVRHSLGLALIDRGRPAEAEAVLGAALRANTEVGNDVGVAYVELALADVDIRAGRLERAAERLTRAARTHCRLGNRDGTAEVLRARADLAAVQRRWRDATEAAYGALEAWDRMGSVIDVAAMLARLECLHIMTGRTMAAAECRDEYRAILADLDLDESCLRVPPFLTRPGTHSTRDTA
ncbi:DNA-binding SARP family transcriptional activator [Herbihabitans rhizosphaerae]|uniref:DNA-binding SARP family transcriptional activator n=1 Tax=Herbihabitans rhizosphaerae TaxID=1872711 RepID=A0A4Q7L4N4_9PSEU|nr:DNA-binding SARP family transcriptional activator [Herbihabitans rhizosphaerae]